MNRIDQLADATVAKIRTVVPALWGTIIAQVIDCAVGHEWLPEVTLLNSATVTAATAIIITVLCVWAVYTAARWIEAQQRPVARSIARVPLVVLKAPSYAAPVTPADPDQPAAAASLPAPRPVHLLVRPRPPPLCWWTGVSKRRCGSEVNLRR